MCKREREREGDMEKYTIQALVQILRVALTSTWIQILQALELPTFNFSLEQIYGLVY